MIHRAVRAWALAPLARPGEPRETTFQKIRLIGPEDALRAAAASFRAESGWSSPVGPAGVADDGQWALVLAGTLSQLDRLAARAGGAVGAALREVLARIGTPPPRMTLGSFTFDFAARLYIAGILNNTPDSFFDRGRDFGMDAALRRAEEIVRQGADLIEVGGESAQQGVPLPAAEEIGRVAPLVRELTRRFPLPVAVDTYKAEVARAAIDAGAVLINDISGANDPRMAEVVRAGGAGLVIMHLHGRPKQHYEDVPVPSMMDWVAAFLARRIDDLVARGVPRDRLLVDPGLNFGKHPARDLELMRRLPELRSLGCPIFVATSRKDYIRDLLRLHPDELLEGTAAAVAFAAAQGANMLRVHDVQVMVRVARMMEFFLGHRRVPTPEEAGQHGQIGH
ncbi:MAG: dihydropteroate synthase [Armatimonadota bacterium]|nr:dihydropteroate synthase [Armatimonadota bacterium]